MGVSKIIYVNTKRREITYELPTDKRLTCLSVQDEDVLLQFDGGEYVVLDRLYNSNLIIL